MRISVVYFQNIQPREIAGSTCGIIAFQAVGYGCQVDLTNHSKLDRTTVTIAVEGGKQNKKKGAPLTFP